MEPSICKRDSSSAKRSHGGFDTVIELVEMTGDYGGFDKLNHRGIKLNYRGIKLNYRGIEFNHRGNGVRLARNCG